MFPCLVRNLYNDDDEEEDESFPEDENDKESLSEVGLRFNLNRIKKIVFLTCRFSSDQVTLDTVRSRTSMRPIVLPLSPHVSN